MIADHTKGQVTPGDFVAPDMPTTQKLASTQEVRHGA
jgi:hypothetical protein